MWKAVLALVAIFTVARPPAATAEGTGILILAHGGSADWNAHVLNLARELDKTQPVEVAFGMATRRTMQEAVDRLNARNVSEIVAVPLFISSWSSIVTSSEFLLGLRPDAPPDLAVFARMDHSRPAAAGDDHTNHANHDSGSDGTKPVVSRAPIVRMTPALNAHPLVGEILTSRARSISRSPSDEVVIIVAHGPVSDSENEQWLADIKVLAGQVAASGGFSSVEGLTVRDDAPKPVRDAATAELRALVQRHLDQHRRVLLTPLLMSFGGIERGIKERLNGLTYSMPDAALIPDARIHAWVLAMVRASAGAQ